MIINHNMNAMNAHRNMTGNTAAAGKSMEKLSSGLRINRAGDDAAGLAISEKMRGQIRGLDQASRNSQDGISMIQTAEGALNETHSILQRMRELSVQASTDTNTAEDRTNVQDEMNQLTKEIDRISTDTEFNTKKLLDGSMGKAVAAAVANIDINTNLKSSAGAALTSATTLIGAQNAAGQGLGVVSGDTVTLSYVKNGTQTTATITVSAATTMADLVNGTDFTATVSTGATGEGTGNLKIVAGNAGFAGGIYGLTMTVKDSTGNTKTAATNTLSAFSETTRAQNQRLDGSSTLHIGANAGQSLNLDIENMSSAALGVSNLQVGTQSQANSAISVIGEAIKKVSTERSKLGATQNRLEHTIANLNTSSENLQASESRVRDVDMAKEMMNFSKNNILSQASQAMLAQAKSQPEAVLQLLR